MDALKFLITITPREFGERYIDYYRKHGMHTVHATLCSGTAGAGILDLLGIEKTEKVMLQTVMPAADQKKLFRGLIHDMGIDIPGNGIALTVPMTSIGGVSSLQYLTGKKEIEKSEVETVEAFKYSMIITITERGYSDLVMDAARSVGANGGTVVRAKGTAPAEFSRFFGVSIAEEKDMVFIVTRHEDLNTIMKAIMTKAGLNTPAKGVVFSIPVESVAGLRSVTDEQ